MGICAYCMLFGTLPIDGLDPVDLFDNIRENKLKLPPPRRRDEVGRSLLNKHGGERRID